LRRFQKETKFYTQDTQYHDVMNSVGDQCNLANEVSQGLKLSKISKDSLYGRRVLQNGDVVIGINEKKIIDTKSGITALNSIRGQGNIILTILRDGQEKTIAIKIE